MAKIFYSMAGEGRGHATRVRAIVEALRGDHELVLFTPGDAFDLLAPVYANTSVRIESIPGLRFYYNERHAIHRRRTVWEAGRYLWQLPGLIGRLCRRIEDERPDLVITDFEPALPRAAVRCGVPFVSLDHQHFLVVNDLSSLPFWLRWQAWLMGLVVRAYYTGQAETIVSSFYSPPLRAGLTNVRQVGVLLRPEILAAERRTDTHLVAYLRRKTGGAVVEALQQLGLPVHIYGLGEQPPVGSLRFCPIDDRRFLEDLATCRGVVSTAGNQLVGEALYLRKPVLGMPEAKNSEQFINAHFLQASGAGDWVEPERIDAQRIRNWLDKEAQYQAAMKPDEVNGTWRAVAAIREHLDRSITQRRARESVLAHA